MSKGCKDGLILENLLRHLAKDGGLNLTLAFPLSQDPTKLIVKEFYLFVCLFVCLIFIYFGCAGS